MEQNKIGTIIKKHRKQKKLTQRQLAELLGVSNTAVCKWEKENNLPDIVLLEPISEILEIDIMELFATQQNCHERKGKRFQKLKRIKFLKKACIIIIFINILCITNILTHNKAMNKLTEYKEKAIEVHKIYTVDSELMFMGYITFNDKESLLCIDRLVFQNPDNLKIKNISEINTKLYLKNEIIYSKNYNLEEEKNKSINDALLKKQKCSPIIASDFKKNLNRIKIEIIFYNKNNENESYSYELLSERQFYK